jgi:hypothetical protein
MPGKRADVVTSGLRLFDVLDRLLESRDERRRVGQVALGQLEFRNQYTGLVDNDQTIALIHSAPPA